MPRTQTAQARGLWTGRSRESAHRGSGVLDRGEGLDVVVFARLDAARSTHLFESAKDGQSEHAALLHHLKRLGGETAGRAAERPR
jgi:hypothetical protein